MTRILMIYVLSLALPLALGACNMTTPSQLRTGQMQIEESVAAQSYDLARMQKPQVASLVRSYESRGRGPMTATVAYRAHDKADLRASQARLSNVMAQLRAAGVRDIRADYVAVNDAKLAGQVVFSYPEVNARAPDHCRRIPGYQGAGALEDIETYQFSCESKDILARMIARPEDLLGRDGKDGGTSRRASAVMETYQDGAQNELFYNIGAASDVGQ